MAEPMTRKEAREQRANQEKDAKQRDEKRVAVEREYARSEETKHPEKIQRFDETDYRKVTGLKQKLNWAIGITIVLIVIVMFVLWFL
ncbi:hypothetical protein PQ472_06910 [Lacticaseibacillus pabuli]|uniref:DUF1510 family protein n=1 Tax=Lacticaseibacillus pabuli TaxID=3025672 RepID=A0ABY7WN93_9LACO|nr:hypothetical protein [Lacticaseibacillus sp. KACC 23028]WDF81660.1 hypothetical protein PQ472_06910 [Lacticaseibacillus sp. KACC 23028]